MDIRLSGVQVRLPPDNRVLFGIDRLNIQSGAHLLIEGPSGAGKTTLLHLIAGLFLPSKGAVSIGTHDLNSMTVHQRTRLRRQHFGMIFQQLNLLDHLTGLENVVLGTPGGREGFVRADASLRRLRMEGFSRRLAAHLSLGEQQRIAVARVLAGRPRIVLADEPTSSLDDKNANDVITALLELPSETTLVVVSHDHRIHERFGNRMRFDEVART